MDPFIGQLMCVGFNFAPRGWALCDGSLLSINQNTALFALLGTTYGGNGTTTFALPDLRGRAPIGQGQGPGLSQIVQGEMSGQEQVTLSVGQMPPHNHLLATSNSGESQTASGNVPANAASEIYGSPTAGQTMASNACGPAGNGLPVGIRNPYIGMYWIIATDGVFPSRP